MAATVPEQRERTRRDFWYDPNFDVGHWPGQNVQHAARVTVAYLDDLQAKVDQLKTLQAQMGSELDALLPSILDRAYRGEL